MKKTNLVLIMTAVFTATFMTSVETTIITTALPTIINKLHGISLQSWVFSVYLLITAITTPIYGKFSDQIGRKPVFLTGLVFFTIGSFFCGVSQSMPILIVSRIIQGIGAGAIMPITFTIIADLFTYERRANILALNNTAWGVSALAGPLIGGFIVDKLNWHWVFFINVPLGVIVILLVLFGYNDKKVTTGRKHIDISGITSLSISLITLLLIFQNLSNQDSSIILEITLLLVFISTTLIFLVVERKSVDPLIPLSLFKNRTFSAQIITALLLSGAQIGFQIYFPIWLQALYRAPASIAGLAITPSPVMWLVASFFVGKLLKKWAPKQILLVVTLILIVAYIPLVFSNQNFNLVWFYVIAGITGAALGIAITTNTVIAQKLVPEENVGLASSMLTLGRTLGQTIMTGMYGLVFNLSVGSQLSKHRELSLSQINEFINSNSQESIINSVRKLLSNVLLITLHNIFYLVILMFLLAIIVNFFDKQKKPI
ncbi:MDR family MFS transporter [Dellaglioa sp. BT-FLS60]